MRGNLIIISAPSGTGKTTILKRLFAEVKGVTFSVSHTTRGPRAGEKDGVDYYFVDQPTFQRLREDNEFLEWAEVHGNFYGTSRREVDRHLLQGLDVFLDIDVQGARQVREAAGGECFSIFIVPPSWEEQERRLTGRGTDSPETIRLRLLNARKEMQDAGLYDFLIVNDTVEQAVDTLRAIIIAQRSRTRRNPDGLPLILPGQ
ncbi:MAG: guanylate kinase [Proteobacteria bacterium]|nr:guanylate kinase [Pseudomonadota bacterium]MBU4297541.1 guanylate kinase [Pseudomonadota bacterium]MCG2746943.1 guanylate kinase [Desulfobulbaceae bacterium]